MAEENRRNRLELANLNKEFSDDYEKFVKEFDVIVENTFEGQKLEILAKEFLNKYRNYIDSFPFEFNYRFPNCNQYETIEEDYRIVTTGFDDVANKKEKVSNDKRDLNKSNNKQTNDNVKESSEQQQAAKEKAAAARQVMADIYRRVAHATYLRVTFNKCRHNKEEDRAEPCEFARRSIRFDSSSPTVVLWFIITLGWHLNTVSNPKERTMLGRLFKASTNYLIKIEPTEPLAHHLLGRYYHSVASLSWIERALAKGFLGAKLEGSYQDAERLFLHAHSFVNWLPSGLWMARVLLAQQRPMEEVKKWIDFGLSMSITDPTTEMERNELLELQAKLKLCSN